MTHSLVVSLFHGRIQDSLSGSQTCGGMTISCPTLGTISTSTMMLTRAISHTPRSVAFATSNMVVPATVIGYRYSVVLRALELQDDAATELVAMARSAINMPLIFGRDSMLILPGCQRQSARKGVSR